MSEEEIRKEYKCIHLADYSAKDKCCRAIEKIIEQQREIEELKSTLKCTQNSWFEDTQKIEELKAKLEFKQFGDLDNAEFEKYIDEYKKNDYIPKSKIEDKIKEYEKELEINKDNIMYYKLIYTSKEVIREEIQAFKELLESEG